METANFFDQLRPILQKHLFPIVFGFLGLMLFGYGLIYLFAEHNAAPGSEAGKEGITFEKADTDAAKTTSDKIMINVAGSVVKPGVYTLKADARVKDALVAAGGLAKDADRDWIQKKLNLAAKLTDAAKIYIPAVGEVVASDAIVGVAGVATSNVEGEFGISSSSDQSGAININSASQERLESLPGIGPVTAQKIIANRPYGSTQDLLSKKVVGAKTFEKIQPQITVQ